MHSVDLSEIQRVVTGYIDQHNLMVAGGPLAASMLVKTFVGKSKAMNLAVAGSAAWLFVQELSGPMLRLMQDQFGYLQTMFSSFHH